MNEQAIKQSLESHFTRILNTHMSGMPVVNPDLMVEALEFRDWDNYQICIMITPWFMSFMLFPAEEEHAGEWKTGSTHRQTFPSGIYEFTAAQDEELGPYQSCSLFSPMFDFNSHTEAQEVAKASMNSLMSEDMPTDEDQESARQISEIWNGEDAEPPAGLDDTNPSKTMSRRDLFRSAIRRGKNA